MSLVHVRFAVLLATSVLTTAAPAQYKPEEVTDAQIASFKANMEAGCTKRGNERGDDSAYVAAFCKCVTRTLEQSVRRPDWQQIYWLDMNQKQAEVQQLFAPYLDRLKACKTE
jgi:hypothetical protein